jgi:predicted nucleic acid-binding protein
VVLTRLPQPHTVDAAQASLAVSSYRFHTLGLTSAELADVIEEFPTRRVVGGAAYDALIAATAHRHIASLLTRDERAASIYERFAVDVRWVSPLNS